MTISAPLVLGALACVLLLDACSYSPLCHSYVEQAYEPKPPSLASSAQPRPVRLAVEFRSNGKPAPGGDKGLRDAAASALSATGAQVVTDAAAADELRISVDDQYSVVDSNVQGTMATFSGTIAGKPAEDHYQFALSYADRRGQVYSREYSPVMATSCGEQPDNFGPRHSSTEAFDIIVENTVWSFLADLHAEHHAGDAAVSSSR